MIAESETRHDPTVPTGDLQPICHSPFLSRAAIALVALMWGTLAFCSEIHDAVRDGILGKVMALLKRNPDLVFSKMTTVRRL